MGRPQKYLKRDQDNMTQNNIEDGFIFDQLKLQLPEEEVPFDQLFESTREELVHFRNQLLWQRADVDGRVGAVKTYTVIADNAHRREHRFALYRCLSSPKKCANLSLAIV
jgi:hypothetical protein